MLDDHHSRTIVQQGLEHPQQHLHIQRVQADGRLVEHEHGIGLGPADLAGQLQTLASPPERLGVSSPRVR